MATKPAVTVDRSPLWDFWVGDKMTPLYIRAQGRKHLLAYVRNLYNFGPDYQQDGSIEAVTDDLWYIAINGEIAEMSKIETTRCTNCINATRTGKPADSCKRGGCDQTRT